MVVEHYTLSLLIAFDKFVWTGSDNECEKQISKYNTSVFHIVYVISQRVEPP